MERTIRIEDNQPAQAFDWFGAQLHLPVRQIDTGGRVSIHVTVAPPHAANPPHCHGCEDEVFYIVEGAAHAQTPGETVDLSAGDLIWLPRGVPHQFTVGHEGATIVTLLAPGAIEHAFVAAAGADAATLRHEMEIWGVTFFDELTSYRHPLAPDPAPPRVVRAHEGDAYWMAGDTYRIKLDGRDTNGRFCLVHFDIPPGGGPKPHVHVREEEVFHILSGEASFYADGETVVGRAGQTVVLPRGIPHAFRNTSSSHTSFLTMVTPSGFEEMVREVGRPATSDQPAPAPDAEEIARLLAAVPRYGVEIRADIDW